MTEIPDFLSHLPVDERRQLPVPVSNTRTDGEHNFAVLYAERQLESARNRTCGVCGKALGYWIAFLGGENSTKSRTFLDPPMHPECAEAATKLCPFISRKDMKRRRSIGEDTHMPIGFEEGRPETYFIYITRSYKWGLRDESVTFRAAPAKEIRQVEDAQEG